MIDPGAIGTLTIGLQRMQREEAAVAGYGSPAAQIQQARRPNSPTGSLRSSAAPPSSSNPYLYQLADRRGFPDVIGPRRPPSDGTVEPYALLGPDIVDLHV